MRARAIPALLLADGGLVKTVKFKNPAYIGDPINAVRLFNDMEVDELVVLDVNASREGRGPNLSLIGDFASEAFMPFGYGGGISTIEQMADLFALGVEKVMLNHAILNDRSLLSQAASRFGNQSVVACIDAKRDLFGRLRVYDHVRRRGTGIDVVEHVRELARAGAGEIVLYDVDRDGAMEGYNLALVRNACAVLDVPLVALGGAGSLDDMAAAVAAGASAAAAGSLFVYQSKSRGVLINYPSRADLEEKFPDKARQSRFSK